MKYDKSEIKQIVKDSIKEALYSVNPKTDEGMFPKDFNRHNLGTCMGAAALATAYFLAKGITNFKIVEGWISMYPDQEENEWSAHTWIEFDDGRKFDPTKKQWEKCGFKVSKTKYEKITRSFTPEEYVKICKGDGSLTEIRLEPPVDNEPVMENMTYDELLQLTAKTPRSPENDTNRIDRSKTVNVRSLPVSIEEDNEQWNFRYKSSPQSTVTDKPYEGHITFLQGEIEKNDDAGGLECKVDCGCPDYMYKFAFNNYATGAGDIGPNSENNAINRRPKPAYDIGEGLCKHLSALSKYLTTKIKATKTQNIFEAINDVAKQGPFNVTYYD